MFSVGTVVTAEQQGQFKRLQLGVNSTSTSTVEESDREQQVTKSCVNSFSIDRILRPDPPATACKVRSTSVSADGNCGDELEVWRQPLQDGGHHQTSAWSSGCINPYHVITTAHQLATANNLLHTGGFSPSSLLFYSMDAIVLGLGSQ